MVFSFSPQHANDVIFKGNLDVNINGIDLNLNDYSDPNEYIELLSIPLPEEPGSSISRINLRHIDFCQDDIVNPPCTENNPNSEVVEDLLVNLVQHLTERIQAGDPITDINESAPQELLDLLPYITHTDKGEINNFTTDFSSMFSFSFSPSDVDNDIIFTTDNLLTTNITGVDLNTANYTDADTPITFSQAPLFNELSIRHINLCPDELVEACLKTNLANAQVIQNLFIDLIDVLIEDYQNSDTGTITNINPPELIELAPYISTSDQYPRIYNFAYSGPTAEYTFSFSDDHPEGEYDVKIKRKKELGDGTPTGGTITSMINFGFDSNPDDYSNFDLNWENATITTTKNQVRHINFCPDDLINRCDVHVAIIVDESGSLTNEGPIAENEKKQIRKGLLDLVTRLRDNNSETKISITGMADSDTYNRTDAIEPTTIDAANYSSTFEPWIQNYGFRYGESGISGSSDFWGGALNVVKGYGDISGINDIPEIVIIITDGAQTDNAEDLQDVIDYFRTESNIYVYGVDNEYYISGSSAADAGGRIAAKSDPNIHPELSNYKQASISTNSSAKNLTPSLFTSLSYLYGGNYIPEMSDIDLLTSDYYPYENFLGLSRGLTPLYNLLIHSGVGCGEPFELCDDCFSFQPIPEDEYWVSAWVKEDLNTQVKTYTNAAIGLRFLDALDTEIPLDPTDPVVTPTLFKATGNIIDGWQRIVGKFKIPGGTLTMKLDLVNESFNIPVYFDDVRVHPIKGNMKSFVYDPITFRLMAELDENNYSTRYNYDKEGGLVRVKKETSKGVKTIQETRSGSVIKLQN